MKKLMVLILTVAGIALCAAFSGKESLQPGCGPQLQSKAQGTSSHFFGITCGNCHSEKNQKAPGCFTVSGSVYNEARSAIHANPVVKLYTEPGGQGKLVATLYGDQLGNYYTTATVDFSEGLYPTLEGTPTVAEPVKHMYRRIFTGECNRCHGATTEALGID